MTDRPENQTDEAQLEMAPSATWLPVGVRVL
jgi:hypothetical protein